MTENLKIEQVQRFLKNFQTIDMAFYSYILDTTVTSDVQNFFVTGNVENILGYTQQEVSANVWRKATHPEDRNKVHRRKKQMHNKQESGVLQYRIIHRDGSIHWVEDHLSINSDKDSYESIVGMIIDITAKKEHEQQIEYMAFYDTLTGLPNRNMLNSYTPKAIARSKRKNTGLAIMYLDLDKFKIVNDTFGHEIGDVLLKQVAQRLIESVRDGDIVTRQGGDEFVILLEDTDSKKLQEVAERILTEIAQPFIINMEKVNISGSIGISLYPQNGEDLDTLIRNADEAMFECKASSNYKFCSV